MFGKSELIRISLLFTALAVASADPITYVVNVNTSSLSGLGTGGIDFQFNPGGTSSPASLEIQNFTSDGALVGTPSVTGDVTGTLPAMLTFVNDTPFNDYFQNFTFGNSLAFDVIFLPGAPNPLATDGSTFAFSLFSDIAGTVPALTSNPAGFALSIDLNLDGTTTSNIFSDQVTATPEPNGLVLLGSALALGLFVAGLRRRAFARNQ